MVKLQIMKVIIKLDIFPLMCVADKSLDHWTDLDPQKYLTSS